jgi:hypothetical protein
MINLDTVFRFRNEALVLREADNEMVLVPLTNDIVDMTNVMVLNEVAADIVKYLDGKTSLRKISEILSGNYDIEKDILEKDIIQFIEMALQRRIVTIVE